MPIETEKETRQNLIDQQLARAGWGVKSRSVIEEFLVRIAEDDPKWKEQHGFADYALLGRDGKPIAIVEAKRTGRDAIAGKRQAAEYADELKKQFGHEPIIYPCQKQVYFALVQGE